MGLVLWIIFGAAAGWIASVIMRTDKSQGIMADIVLGILGAIVGGFIFGMFGQVGVTGYNVYSLLVAIVGALVLISAGRMLRPHA